MPLATTRVQPPLDFIPPRFNPGILAISRALLPIWLSWQTDLSDIQVKNLDTLVHLYEQFQKQQTRFLLAFRHPSPDDPVAIAYLLWRAIPQQARDMGIRLERPVHAHFLYDRGIPLWAGRWLGWLGSNLGGVPIQRGKLDLAALKTARQLFCNGDFPMAVAPEGANNGHSEIVSPLEPGIAQLGFWGVEDLRQTNRPESVVIVPVGLQYRYVAPPWKKIADLLSQLEQKSGLNQPLTMNRLQSLRQRFAKTDLPTQQAAELYGRLFRLAEYLLTLMEQYYRQFYSITLPAPDLHQTPQEQLAQRLQKLLDAALSVAEDYFTLRPKGGLIDRCRRIEQAGWERIFRADLGKQPLSPVERGLADRIAEEADLRMWHMRIVESFVAVTGHYVLDRPVAERFGETALLLWALVTRLEGGNPFPRPSLGPLSTTITVGKPISVSDRWPSYQQNRRHAVATLTRDLQAALEALIIPTTPAD